MRWRYMIKTKVPGEKFNLLTLIRPIGFDNQNRPIWLCKCDCGNTKNIRYWDVVHGKIKSCGCLRNNKARDRLISYNKSHNVKHNDCHARLYNIWHGMIQRCYNPNYHHYKDYGGRGIKICDEWKYDYLTFKKWAIENGYSDCLTIDRLDVNGDYEPSNCKWSTNTEQARNRRNNLIITYRGKSQTLMEWSNELNIKYCILWGRLKKGWSVERTFERPVGWTGKQDIFYNGKYYFLSELAREYNVSPAMLKHRLKKGMDVEKALTQPSQRKNNPNK